MATNSRNYKKKKRLQGRDLPSIAGSRRRLWNVKGLKQMRWDYWKGLQANKGRERDVCPLRGRN